MITICVFRGVNEVDIKKEVIDDFYINIMKSYSYEMPFFHYHDCYEIFFVLDGERKMIFQDEIYSGTKGDVFLVSPCCIHRTGGKGCKRIVINFSKAFLNRFFKEELICDMLKCFDVTAISLDEKQANLLSDEMMGMLQKVEKNDGKLALKLVEILFFLSDHVKDHFNMESNSSEQLATEVLKYINDNFKDISGLSVISDRFHVSKDYLCRVFKCNANTTIMNYVYLLKIEEAKKLLVGTKRKIDDIAIECGFTSSSYFSKAFKKICGMSPAQFRNKTTVTQTIHNEK